MMRVIKRSHLVGIGFEPRRLNRVRYLKKLEVLRLYRQPIRRNLGYLLTDPEVDNFTYELENESELCQWLADAFSADYAHVCTLLVEARSNPGIYDRLRAAVRDRRSWSMRHVPPLGRRLGWYVIVRLLQPDRMIETGIHDGLGSLVLLAAMDANRRGTLISTDVENTAGWIVGQHPRWDRRILKRPRDLVDAFVGPVDIFLHDSLHTLEHERFELELAAERLPDGLLISDNSHVSDVLRDIAERHGRIYKFWHESPRGHFYTGGGIGVALSAPRNANFGVREATRVPPFSHSGG